MKHDFPRHARLRAHTSPFALLIAATLGVACSSSSFEDCTVTRTCVDAEASGGEDGDPRGSEGGSGDDTSAGGAGAGAGDRGGTSTGGTDSNGSGGIASGGTAGDDSGQAGSTSIPAGGQGGDGGQGGEGSGLPEGCTGHADCDDGLLCNGLELCVEGSCQVGMAPCGNPDPDHCAPTCEESAEGPVCGVQGRDADGDGYLDALCAQAPGNDCNDTAGEGAAIHPGATEICNAGTDDDCDGIDETGDEEVPLAGASEVFVAASGASKRDEVSIAPIPGGGFGVVWSDWRHEAEGVTSEIYYRTLAADGTAGDEVRVTLSPLWFENRRPDLIYGSGKFGIAFRGKETADSDQWVRFLQISADGSSVSDLDTVGLKNTVTGGPKVGYDNSYDPDATNSGADPFKAWQVYWHGASQRYREVPYTPYSENESSVVESFAVASDISGSTVVVFAEYDEVDGYVIGSEPDEQQNVGSASSSANDNATSVVATAQSGTLSYAYHLDPAGSAQPVLRVNSGRCLPKLDFAEAYPVDIEATPTGVVILYWNAEKTALYLRAVHTPNTGCEVGPSALVVEEGSDTAIGSAAIAVDEDANVAIVWSANDTVTGEWSIQRRLFSPKLCE